MKEKKPFPTFPILIVDDEEDALQSLGITLKSFGINNLKFCSDSRNVMSLLREHRIQLVLMDLTMPYFSGEELLPLIVRDFPEIPVIIITANHEVETAVECMKTGALDYILKPVEKNRLKSSIMRRIEYYRLQQENIEMKKQLLENQPPRGDFFAGTITRSPSLISIFKYIEVVSKSPEPVLITGETGVGKELIAKAVHLAGGRDGEFISVNVAGLDDNVFSDTLFGHRKGAFTDASQSRMGLIENARDGTLFLDEIGDLSQASQIKLLRLLQEREYFPLGSDIAKKTEVHIIAATNKNLEILKNSNCFRNDLYYRLHVHHIHVPPLRERREDIPLLVDHFLRESASTLGKKPPGFPSEIYSLFYRYDFPGNIRELKSIIHDAVSTHRSGTLSFKRFRSMLSQELLSPAGSPIPNEMDKKPVYTFRHPIPTLQEAEEQLIFQALEHAGMNQTVAAQLLGIARQTLNKKLKKIKQGFLDKQPRNNG